MTKAAVELSLCAITRDEEASLPRLLASVEGLVDEIVIADTGSVDSTVTIAEQAGGRVVPFAWCDDFSAAYNHALDHARGEWILLLDADEELTPGSHESIRKLLSNDEAFAYTMLRQDYYGEQVRADGYTEMLQTRLFRRRDSVRFVGRIHQQLEPRLTECAQSEGRRTLASDLRFRHYGYLGNYRERKLDRTIRLLELELQDRPDSFYYLVELGRAKIHSGDPAGATQLHQAAQHIVSGREPLSPLSGSLAMLLEELLVCDVLPNDFPLTLPQVEQIAHEYFSDSIPILWRRALKRFKEERFADSAKLLERILSLAESNSYSRLVSFVPDSMQGDALLNLGVCYTRMYQLAGAATCFEKLLDHPKHGPFARQNLDAIRQLKRR